LAFGIHEAYLEILRFPGEEQEIKRFGIKRCAWGEKEKREKRCH